MNDNENNNLESKDPGNSVNPEIPEVPVEDVPKPMEASPEPNVQVPPTNQSYPYGQVPPPNQGYPYGQNPQPNQGYPYGTVNPQQRGGYYGSPNYFGTPSGGQQPPQSPYYNPNSFYSNQNRPEPPKPKNSKIGKSIFIVLVCICLFVSAISVGYAFSKDSNDSATNNSDSVTLSLNDTPTSEGTASENGELSATAIYDKVCNSSVGILVYYNSNSSLSSSSYGEGSGVIMGEDSTGAYTYIITCAHVISESNSTIKVQVLNGDQYDATIVGYDTKTDIGVLKIKATGLTAAEFGDSSSIKVGQTIYAIGNPGGTEFFGSFTKGMVSAIARPVDSPVGYEVSCVQHDAAINPGNSGGALVNSYGQIIGINSSKIADTDYEGMGFAVPSATVKEIFDEIVANGYVTNRAKLGITYASASQSQAYTMIVQMKNYPAGSLILSEIQSDSSLYGTEAVKGDLIIKANGNPLDTSDVLLDLVENGKAGDKIVLTLVHIGNDYSTTEYELTAVLVEDKGNTTIATTEPPTSSNYYNPFGS